MDNSSVWHDDIYVGFVDNGSESENRVESASEVIQDENNLNHNKGEAEEDHDGSDDEDDDDGTRTYWRVKAKEGHKVRSLCLC